MRSILGAVLLLLSIALAASCAKNLEDLTPFPCADDGTCPKGYACLPDVGCGAAQIDSPCVPGATDCATAAAGATCALGICTTGCTGDESCDAGRVCSAGGTQGSGVCLADCAAGQACPKGLECIDLGYAGKKGCANGEDAGPLGKPCTSVEECAAAGSEVLCDLGVCVARCEAGAVCGEGKVCSLEDGSGSCLTDCSTGESCGPGLECKPLWYGGRRGCMGDWRVNACAGVNVLARCPSAFSVCGTALDAMDCGSFTCPDYTTCEAASCNSACADGTSTSCQGQPCTGPECTAANWWCAPTDDAVGCNDSVSHHAVVCECRDGHQLVGLCGNPLTCEEMCRNECDPFEQDCPAPAAPKCAFTQTDGKILTQCVAESGPKGEGEPCERVEDGPEGVGHDDCQPGLHCTSRLSGDGSFACRRVCDWLGADCPNPGQTCALLEWGSELSVCAEACDVFADACPAGLFCKGSACLRPDPDGYAMGDPCLATYACADDLLCSWVGRCTTSCDDTHPCDAPFVCGYQAEDPPHKGFCTP